MAPADEDGAPAAASASERRRGRRKVVFSWGAVFCFGSRGEEALAEEGRTPCERPRRRKRRTVPVDGDLLPGTADRDVMGLGADSEESRKGLRLQGCCFLAPARAPGRKHSTMDSGRGSRSTHNKQRQLEHTEQPPPPRSPSEAPAPSATGGSRLRRAERPRGAPGETRAPTNEESSRGVVSARGPRPKASADAGAFGPVAGLCVVAAVSMAGLLGGRLWAVACVCAWIAALSGLRRRAAGSGSGSGTAGSGGGGEAAVAVRVDSTSADHKKLVVLRGLLERDRAKHAVIP